MRYRPTRGAAANSSNAGSCSSRNVAAVRLLSSRELAHDISRWRLRTTNSGDYDARQKVERQQFPPGRQHPFPPQVLRAGPRRHAGTEREEPAPSASLSAITIDFTDFFVTWDYAHSRCKLSDPVLRRSKGANAK